MSPFKLAGEKKNNNNNNSAGEQHTPAAREDHITLKTLKTFKTLKTSGAAANINY